MALLLTGSGKTNGHCNAAFNGNEMRTGLRNVTATALNPTEKEIAEQVDDNARVRVGIARLDALSLRMDESEKSVPPRAPIKPRMNHSNAPGPFVGERAAAEPTASVSAARRPWSGSVQAWPLPPLA